MRVLLSQAVHRAIEKHGEQTYPFECCGFLLGNADGEGREVSEIFQQENQKESGQETRYLIRPEAYKAAESYAKEKGLELVGIYHSHPDHPSRPSQYDLEHAWPWYAYLILAVHSGKAGSLDAWEMRDDRSAFDESELIITEKAQQRDKGEVTDE